MNRVLFVKPSGVWRCVFCEAVLQCSVCRCNISTVLTGGCSARREQPYLSSVCGLWWQRQITTVTQGAAKPRCLATQMASCRDEQELEELLPCVSWQCSAILAVLVNSPCSSLMWCTCALIWCHSPTISIPVPFPRLFHSFLPFQLLVGSSWSHCSLACAPNLVSFLHAMFLRGISPMEATCWTERSGNKPDTALCIRDCV